MKLNCIIVDDEPLAQDILETYIQKIPDLNLVQKCNNAVEALQLLKEQTFDLIFLDIQMPEITGLEFLKSLDKPPAVIFTTAYSEYAIDGFNLDAVDYLLKPISFDRFLKAVNKAIANAAPNNTITTSSGTDAEGYVFVKTDKKMVKVRYRDIIYVEGLKDYVMIYTPDSRLVTLMTMKSLDEQLPSNYFKRIHKSYIISIDKIKAVVGNSVELENASKLIPIGNMYKDDFFKIIEEHNLVK